jgi:hypothetical protein
MPPLFLRNKFLTELFNQSIDLFFPAENELGQWWVDSRRMFGTEREREREREMRRQKLLAALKLTSE